jgi:hypothetical protein
MNGGRSTMSASAVDRCHHHHHALSCSRHAPRRRPIADRRSSTPQVIGSYALRTSGRTVPQLAKELVVEALETAVARRSRKGRPVHHSDQGIETFYNRCRRHSTLGMLNPSTTRARHAATHLPVVRPRAPRARARQTESYAQPFGLRTTRRRQQPQYHLITLIKPVHRTGGTSIILIDFA